MPIVHFEKENKSVEVNSCWNLRKVAQKSGVNLYSGIHKIFNCHGMGLCGSCAVDVDDETALSPKRRGEEKLLIKNNLNNGKTRLACQCLVYKDAKVTTRG